MEKKMISSAPIRCGLGDQPSEYSQNASELVNRMIKISKQTKYTNSKGSCSTDPEQS